MSKIDYQKLREIAEKTKIAGEAPVMPFDQRINALNDFMKHFSPDIALALLDERERNQQYIKRRDQENEDIALTVGKLLIENGRLVADTLRHLADNEIDSDYFAITSTNENGTEIDHEMAITDYALQAAGTVDELVAALESAEKRIAELEAREILLPERSSMLHRTDFHDDYQTVMAYKVSEVIAAIRAAGIRIKGDAGEQNDEKP
ncbi:ead/Ea22-like family protein [Escherichia coli]|nr:ead/Ea22-like family protein [Escherichia coli]EFH4213979.1 ead/Ea22-like family protein [Escherichia coli]EGZ8564296.1 ead/Ea22-like family protein [Escherichia coli]EHH6326303.1 ead/Ea22-like family protein [Escherichia coli]EHO1999086.1 ead/Ea22-like family protein [Escherichia coli]